MREAVRSVLQSASRRILGPEVFYARLEWCRPPERECAISRHVNLKTFAQFRNPVIDDCD